MKILIISDTHRNDSNFRKLLETVGDIDALVHCGDLEGSEDYYWRSVPCSVYMVAGNNDYYTTLPRERVMELAGRKVLLCHGHDYYVSMTKEVLRDTALSRGCSMAIFGHTHRPYLEEEGGVTLLNPGSLSYPRQSGRVPSYAIMEGDPMGKMEISIHYLDEN